MMKVDGISIARNNNYKPEPVSEISGASMKKIIAGKEEFLSNLNLKEYDDVALCTELGVHVNTKGLDFKDINNLFSNADNLEGRLAKEYETRYNKIKIDIKKNPELKVKEKELIKQLDDTFEDVFNYQGKRFAKYYGTMISSINGAKEHISEELGVKNQALKEIDNNAKKQLKREYVNFFKSIINQVKQGKSSEFIKGKAEPNNKYVNSYLDIKSVRENSILAFNFGIEASKTRSRVQAGDDSFSEKISKFKSLIKDFNAKFNKVDVENHFKKFWDLGTMFQTGYYTENFLRKMV